MARPRGASSTATAAFERSALSERVLPEVPIRQWVCSLPWQLRYVLGYDRALCAAVLGAFVADLARSYRQRAKREHVSR
jgi:hypothetical protein